MNLQRVGIKLFTEGAPSIELPELIPVFHRWVQTGAVPGLPIDVANYSHVHNGPGIVLVCHEGNYAVDMTDGRMGALYYRKQPLDGDLSGRLRIVCRAALDACRLLAEAPELSGRMQFRTGELLFIANDRLLSPNRPETMAAVQPALRDLVTTLYDSSECVMSHGSDPRERFTVAIRAPQAVPIPTLLQRLG